MTEACVSLSHIYICVPSLFTEGLDEAVVLMRAADEHGGESQLSSLRQVEGCQTVM